MLGRSRSAQLTWRIGGLRAAVMGNPPVSASAYYSGFDTGYEYDLTTPLIKSVD